MSEGTLGDLVDSSYPEGQYVLKYGMPSYGKKDREGAAYYLKFETTIVGGEKYGCPYTYVRSLSKKAAFMIGRDLVGAGVDKTTKYPSLDPKTDEEAKAWADFVTPIFGGRSFSVDMTRRPDQNGDNRNEIRIKGDPAFGGASTPSKSPFG